MGTIFDSFDQLARLTLEALLNSIWQGMLITVLVWVLLRMMGRVSATTRHAIWMISLLTIGALPFIVFATKFHDTTDAGAIDRTNFEKGKPATGPLLGTPEEGHLVISEPNLIPGDGDAPATGGSLPKNQAPDAAAQAPLDGQPHSVAPL